MLHPVMTQVVMVVVIHVVEPDLEWVLARELAPMGDLPGCPGFGQTFWLDTFVNVVVGDVGRNSSGTISLCLRSGA